MPQEDNYVHILKGKPSNSGRKTEHDDNTDRFRFYYQFTAFTYNPLW